MAEKTLLISRLIIADTFWRRLIGWAFRKSVRESEGLWILPCKSVHTCFCRFPMAIVFLDQENRVIHLIPSMKPWRFSPFIADAKSVLEMSPIALKKTGLQVGDQILILQ